MQWAIPEPELERPGSIVAARPSGDGGTYLITLGSTPHNVTRGDYCSQSPAPYPGVEQKRIMCVMVQVMGIIANFPGCVRFRLHTDE